VILRARGLLVRRGIGLPLALAGHVIARIDQDPAQPRPDTRLPVKTFDPAVKA
jgi:hypothetical protein